jgi:hypothetical protein
MRSDLIGEDGGEMYGRMNERSELQRFRDRHDEEELDEFVDRHESLWRGFFEAEMEREVPRHPWKVLKEARSHYAEERNNGEWPSMEKRHALRVVKDEYVEKWKEYKENFNKG